MQIDDSSVLLYLTSFICILFQSSGLDAESTGIQGTRLGY